jgi:LacI family transcriptional regulator
MTGSGRHTVRSFAPDWANSPATTGDPGRWALDAAAVLLDAHPVTTLTPAGTSRPTMADVAAQAKVSVKTVSRVINDEPGVRPETARRVRAVIERLGFQRHEGARLLRQGRTASIGVVVEDLANPFYSSIAAAVEREARWRDHLVVIASAEGSPQREREIVASLVARRVDGLIVVPAADADGAEGAEGAVDPAGDIPVVYVDRPGPGPAGDTVLSDNVGGIRSAVEHLVANGHRAIGFVGDDPACWTSRQRREAFEAAHRRLRLVGEPRVAMGPHQPDEIAQVLTRWLDGPEPLTAVVTGNNRITISALQAIRSIGADLGLVGYDDFDLADFVEPAITVVHQDPASMGQKAAQQLFVRLIGDRSPPAVVTMPTRLIVRASAERRTDP